MSNYLRNARYHADQIEHYYKHAWENAYSQALYHLQEIERLLRSANQSARGQNDVIAIRATLDSIYPKMDEMQNRQNNKL